jgi:hypothetical protein
MAVAHWSAVLLEEMSRVVEVLQLWAAVALGMPSVVGLLVVLLAAGSFELGVAVQTDLELEVEQGQVFLVVRTVAWQSCLEYRSN